MNDRFRSKLDFSSKLYPKKRDPEPITPALEVGDITTEENQKLILLLEDFYRHMLIVGTTGVGKSYLLRLICRFFMTNLVPFILIDPHSQVYEWLLKVVYVMSCIPELEEEAQAIIDRLVVIDIPNDNWVYGLNPLAPKGNLYDQIALFSEMSRKVWGQDDYSQAFRVKHYQTVVSYLIAKAGGTLEQAFLATRANQKIRDMLKTIPADPLIKESWDYVMAQSPNRIEELLSSTAHRLAEFVSYERPRLMTSQVTNLIDFDEILKEKKIVLINLGGELTPDQQKLIGTMLIHELTTATYRRLKREKEPTKTFLVCDEFDTIATNDFVAMLNARKFGMYGILAVQNLSQLQKTPESTILHDSIISLCRNKVIFGEGNYYDTEYLARQTGFKLIDLYRLKDAIVSTKFRPLQEWVEIVAQTRGYNRGGSTSKTNQDNRSTSTSIHTHYGRQLPGKTLTESEGASGGNSEQDTWNDTESETVTRTPITNYQEFQEEHSRSYFTIEEQFFMITRFLLEQPNQYCSIYTGGNLNHIKVENVSELKDWMQQVGGNIDPFIDNLIANSGCVKLKTDAEAEAESIRKKFDYASNRSTTTDTRQSGGDAAANKTQPGRDSVPRQSAGLFDKALPFIRQHYQSISRSAEQNVKAPKAPNRPTKGRA